MHPSEKMYCIIWSYNEDWWSYELLIHDIHVQICTYLDKDMTHVPSTSNIDRI